MKASELRIGNLAQDQHGNLLKVCNLSDQNPDITFSVIDRSKFPLPRGWRAEGIPLTEKWLNKFNGDQVRSLNIILIEGHYFFERYWPGKKNVELKYVHQLQNLYHALTGEELTLKK